MPKMKIPCEDCEGEKERIEEAGDQEVISCGPIEEEPGWCEIVWRRRGGGRAIRRSAKPRPAAKKMRKKRSKRSTR